MQKVENNNVSKFCKRILLAGIRRTRWFWPDKLFIVCKYRLIMGGGYLNEPQTFNEKLQWLKLNDKKPQYTQMVDKYGVKEYVSKTVGKEYVIKTLGVWDSFDEIDFDLLPNRFVLKTTHDSGGVVVVKDKDTFNKEAAAKKLKKSLKTDYYIISREWPYKDVHRKILAEEYMEDESGSELKDYKFFCFNGEVKFLKVDFDRFTEHRANYYDKQWNLLPFGEAIFPPNPNRVIPQPSSFDEMLFIAEKLSKGIPFVRVDLYDVCGKVYFGEITFYPASGMGKFVPEEWDKKIGEWLVLPQRKPEQ